MIKQFISYEGLPISAGGAHGLGKMLPDEAFHKTYSFIKSFAFNNPAPKIHLELYQSERKNYSVWKLLPGLIRKLGIPSFHSDGYLSHWSWSISQNKLELGLEALTLNKELPKNPQGPLTLSLLWHFHFQDPITKQIIPHQKDLPEIDSRLHNSRAYLRLSNKSTLAVWFAFPFEKMDDFALKYIESVKTHLPFKTSDKQWRIWTKSDKGSWIPRKFEFEKV